ncbi:F0F1 ATP synthase subunit gamma [Bifidobacterium sp. LC6]|uniref:F0F1 ATP synthase subunit gamma n=1 Tax=Bifidobacterium colobi TaxID=2809026 RepID=A0ABS5UXK0_9BIFI|nr:F0F1 ATP synthase subunit gamma [Bifidobacterium colobi]MBT1175851.1 F0F1 ATP synthase subunit gamma [Bifidobacterium colobi]
MSIKVKNVVKVMNFHALLRVDAAKRHADQYQVLEREVESMMDNIANNRNFILDKKALRPNPKAPELVIYIGSDFGFCGNYNSQVNDLLAQASPDTDAIIIGKKLHHTNANVLMRVEKDELDANPHMLENIVAESIREMKHRKVSIVYNRYENASSIHLDTKTVFPVEVDDSAGKEHPYDYDDDFVVEGNINDLMRDLTMLYINYEIRLCMVNANASENVLRQSTTSESLKKIDEREEEELKWERKQRRAQEFKKVIESFVTLKSEEGRPR